MKKIMMLSILSLAMMLTSAGCSGNQQNNVSTPDEVPAQEQSPAAETPIDEPEVPLEDAPQDGEESHEPPLNQLNGLTENEYDGLTMTAAILERKAILPGSSIPVTITIQNNGDKAIVYTQGSGVFQTPQALYVQVEGLQTVLPKDHLGPATMDFVTKRLEPGESLSFIATVLAIEPNAEFDNFTYDAYNKEKLYLGELEWADLKERHPDLVEAASGSYNGHAYFTYFVPDESKSDPLGSPTGYSKADFVVGVTG